MMITDIEDYFSKGCGRCERFDTPGCSAKVWAQGIATLRNICLSASLKETVKWGHPCYMHADRNIAIIGAFRADFRLSFFDAVLLKDREGVLEKQGPNTEHADMIRFTSNDGPGLQRDVIRAYLNEARAYAAQGKRPPMTQRALDLPMELIEALDTDLELAEAFHRLTPGRQRSYIINLNGAKKPETRVSRIKTFRVKILDGKGATER